MKYRYIVEIRSIHILKYMHNYMNLHQSLDWIGGLGLQDIITEEHTPLRLAMYESKYSVLRTSPFEEMRKACFSS